MAMATKCVLPRWHHYEPMASAVLIIASTLSYPCSCHSPLQVPFGLVATAYRRKRLMEGIMSSDRSIHRTIQQMSEQHAHEVMAAQAREAECGYRHEANLLHENTPLISAGYAWHRMTCNLLRHLAALCTPL